MKALKQDATIHLETVCAAIDSCYSVNRTPTNTELMRLYAAIGSAICAQGEKAFVVHLANFLTAQFPTIKGFSPRNLRRMRDFFKTYESRADLMERAQRLNWTQNAVILDYCETDEQREFYLALAEKKQLSKLALLAAIQENAMEKAEAEEAAPTVPAYAPVCEELPTARNYPTESTKAHSDPAMTACRNHCLPLRVPWKSQILFMPIWKTHRRFAIIAARRLLLCKAAYRFSVSQYRQSAGDFNGQAGCIPICKATVRHGTGVSLDGLERCAAA